MKNQSALLRNIPNLLTCLNLLCGCVAILAAFDLNLFKIAPYFILLAALFDLTDGLAARLLGAYSEIGLQLDSLADVISFGVAPAMLVFQLMHMTIGRDDPLLNMRHLSLEQLLMFGSCLLLPVFSALRLAKFNIDKSQTYAFKGLPTPAMAFFFSSYMLLLFVTRISSLKNLLLNKYMILATVLLFSFLMVSNIPMTSLKFKTLNFRENADRYILISGSGILFIILGIGGLVLIIPFYILISVVFGYFLRVEK